MSRTSDGSTSSLVCAIPLLWDFLDFRERGCLRGSCREARLAVTRCVKKLCFKRPDKPSFGPPSIEELPRKAAAGVRSLLARGCRPFSLELRLPLDSASPAYGHGILTELAALPPSSLITEVTLEGLPLSAEAVRDLAAALPCPRVVCLHGYHLLQQAPEAAADSGLQCLLRHAAPHLRRLELRELGLAAGAHSPQAALDSLLASLLQPCSRLESLWLTPPRAAVEGPTITATLHALAELPALRSLTLHDPGPRRYNDPVPPPWHHTLPPGLSRLTYLSTSAGVEVVLPAMASLCGLVELDLLSSRGLRTSHLAEVAGLTALTRLRLSGLRDSAPAAWEVAGLAPPGRPGAARWPLPPQLQSMSLDKSLDIAVMAALQLPASLTRLVVSGLVVLYDGATDEDGCLLPAAAEALLVSCRRLSGRGSDAHNAQVATPYVVNQTKGFSLDLGWAYPPDAWQSYSPLFAALQPLALRNLHLQCGTLAVRDVDALVRHLPLLEALTLYGALELAALPFLHRLDRLSFLEVYLDGIEGQGQLLADGWDDELALRGALLVLCTEAPRLHMVIMHLENMAMPGDVRAAADGAMEWLDTRLPHLVTGRSPTIVDFRGGGPAAGGVGGDPAEPVEPGGGGDVAVGAGEEPQ